MKKMCKEINCIGIIAPKALEAQIIDIIAEYYKARNIQCLMHSNASAFKSSAKFTPSEIDENAPSLLAETMNIVPIRTSSDFVALVENSNYIIAVKTRQEDPMDEFRDVVGTIKERFSQVDLGYDEKNFGYRIDSILNGVRLGISIMSQ